MICSPNKKEGIPTVHAAPASPDTTASWRIPSTSYLGDILAYGLLP